MAETFDVIIIGSGQAGNPLATAFSEAGKKTAVIEKSHIGGTCVNEGCTPTKTMVASARVAYLARRATDYGVHMGVGEVYVSMKEVRDRKRAIVDEFRGGSENSLEESENVEVILGTGSFSGEKTVMVMLRDGTTRELTAETIIINVGGRPAQPDIQGLSTIPYLDSTSIMEVEEIPSHLVIIGGGYISLEFGQMFRRFGSDVTIIESMPRFLSREDEDIAECMKSILEEDGIEVLVGATVDSITMNEGSYQLKVSVDGKVKSIQGSHVLVAVGRTPNSDLLNLKAAGVETNERGWIPVNEKLETNVKGIYALGDINGGPAFTHISYDDYRVLRANLIDDGKRSTKERLVPYTMYTDPQLGRVGMSETEARKSDHNIKLFTMPMASVARARETDEMRGMLKVIVDEKSEQILGAAVIGIEGGEIMTMLQIAMMGKLPYTALRDAVFAHPALAEGLNNLFLDKEEES